MDHEIRFQRKRFKCVKCKMKLSKLVSYDTFQTNCKFFLLKLLSFRY